jgi:hypothetical protein
MVDPGLRMGYPQGEKNSASRRNRSARRATNILPQSQARQLSRFRLGRWPRPTIPFNRLKTSSICQRPRYRHRTSSPDNRRRSAVQKTDTYSACSSVSGRTTCPFFFALRSVMRQDIPFVRGLDFPD